MKAVCLDLEGVLIPEIWIAVAKKTGITELQRTTRDEPNYDKLMRFRLGILRERRIKLRNIQNIISGMRPLAGASSFLNKLRSRAQVILLSDTFYEFAKPLIKQLKYPTLFCNSLRVDSDGFVTGYHLRQKDGKAKVVRALKGLGFRVHAAGDSYNDLSMLFAADRGVLFRPPQTIQVKYPHLPAVNNHTDLIKKLRL